MRFVLIGVLALAACHHHSGARPEAATHAGPDKPLFVRLGGQPAIDKVVGKFVDTTGSDPRISQYFTNVDKEKLKASMDEHICSITGGGCTYHGKSMLEAHTGMKLQQQDFDAFMDDLAKTLAELKVPERESGEVMAAFRGMQGDVVGH
jgi:hemoglobin